jgi:hypothetical protein
MVGFAVMMTLGTAAIADPSPPPEFYVLTGRVATRDGDAVVGARVDVSCTKPARIRSDGYGDQSAWSGLTNDRGRFTSAHSLRGDCTIVVTATGYAKATAAASLPGAHDVQVIVDRAAAQP